MGIPGYFRQIITKYPQIVALAPKKPVEHLLWDFNGALYGSYERVSRTNVKTAQDFETALLQEIGVTVKAVFDQFQPTKTFQIGVDGPVPLHKMNEQRTRRFKRQLELHWLPSLLDKITVQEFTHTPTPPPLFSTQSFTPGSPFYVQLQSSLETIMEELSKENSTVQFILNGPFAPGEAELKLLQWVETNTNPDDEDEFHIISDDADLLAQPARLAPRTFHIIRHSSKLPSDWWQFYQNQTPSARNQTLPNYVIVSLDTLYREYFNALEKDHSTLFDQRTPQSIFYDLLAITFFQGNDFVKPIWFLPSNQETSLQILLNLYSQTLTAHDTSLIYIPTKRSPVITWSLRGLHQLFQKLARIEREQMIQQLRKILRQGSQSRTVTNEEELPDFLTWFQHKPFIQHDHPFHKPYQKQVETLLHALEKSSGEMWKKTFYGLTQPFSDELIEEYLQSLQWNLQYYFDFIPPHWGWTTLSAIAPLPSDIVSYLEKRMSNAPSFTNRRHDRLDVLLKNWGTTALPNEPPLPITNWMLVIPPYPSWFIALQSPETQTSSNIIKSYQKQIEQNGKDATEMWSPKPDEPPVILLTGHKWVAPKLHPHLPTWPIDWITKNLPTKLSQSNLLRNAQIPPLDWKSGKLSQTS